MALPFELILITDEAPRLVDRIARALTTAPPGRVAVQLRLKSLPAGELLPLAQELRQLTTQAGAPLLINDRVDVALAVGADGVHLPGRGLPPDVARRLLGSTGWVGVSCHGRPELERAEAAGADYATLAPVHPVPGKGPPLGLEGFARAIHGVRLPVYALGGVTEQNVAELMAAGARGVALIRHVLGTADPAQPLSALLARLHDPAQP